MSKYSTAKARQDFAEIVNKVAYGKERIIVTRQGKDFVAIICIDDMKLLEKIEDYIDIEDARKAIKEKGSIPFEKIKKKVGL